jgi:hypothetical protein
MFQKDVGCEAAMAESDFEACSHNGVKLMEKIANRINIKQLTE